MLGKRIFGEAVCHICRLVLDLLMRSEIIQTFDGVVSRIGEELI